MSEQNDQQNDEHEESTRYDEDLMVEWIACGQLSQSEIARRLGVVFTQTVAVSKRQVFRRPACLLVQALRDDRRISRKSQNNTILTPHPKPRHKASAQQHCPHQYRKTETMLCYLKITELIRPTVGTRKQINHFRLCPRQQRAPPAVPPPLPGAMH